MSNFLPEIILYFRLFGVLAYSKYYTDVLGVGTMGIKLCRVVAFVYIVFLNRLSSFVFLGFVGRRC
jgi:hypothetical protein